MKIAHNYAKDGRAIKSSSIQKVLIGLFRKIKPKRIIETGTHFGTGSTHMISLALKKNNLIDSVFYSIEVNPVYCQRAEKNIKKLWGNIILINGLSLPRQQLPNKKMIEQEITSIKEDFFIDYDSNERVNSYYEEVDFPNVNDDCLGRLVKEEQPDFVLLDSAGHVGTREFQYLISLLKKPCYIALDDTCHFKHYADFEMAKKDKRFEIIYETKERFGFGILHYRI